MNPKEYWEECIGLAAEECGLTLTADQLGYLADSVEVGHDNYGMAFYSPPSSDRLTSIEREWKAKYATLQRESDDYRVNAETAVKRALKQYDDASVSIGEHGEVFRHGGRDERIL